MTQSIIDYTLNMDAIKEILINVENLIDESLSCSYSGRHSYKIEVEKEIKKIRTFIMVNPEYSHGYMKEKVTELESACKTFYKRKSKYSRDDSGNKHYILVALHKLRSNLCFGIR